MEGLAHTWHCAGNRSSGGGGGDKLIPLRLFETRDLCRYPKETFCPLSTPPTPTTPTSLLQFFPSLLLSPKKGGWAIREAGLYRVRPQGHGVRRGEEEEGGGGGGGLCSLPPANPPLLSFPMSRLLCSFRILLLSFHLLRKPPPPSSPPPPFVCAADGKGKYEEEGSAIAIPPIALLDLSPHQFPGPKDVLKHRFRPAANLQR